MLPRVTGAGCISGCCMRFRRYWGAGILTFLGVFLLLVFVFRQVLFRLVLRWTVDSISKSVKAQVVYREVRGDIFSAPRLMDVRVKFAPDSVVLKEVAVRYHLPSLLRGRVVLRSLEAVEPEVYLTRAPGKSGTGVKAGAWRFPEIAVGRFEIKRGRLFLDGRLAVDSCFAFMGFSARGGNARLSLDSARLLVLSETRRVSLERLAGTVGLFPESVRARDVEIFTRSSRLRGGMVINLKTGAVGAEVSELSLDTREFTKFPGRVWFQGGGSFGGAGTRAQGRWVADGLFWRGVRIPRLVGGFEFEDSSLRVVLAGRDSLLGAFEFRGALALSGCAFTAHLTVESLAVYRLQPGALPRGRCAGGTFPEFRITAEVSSSGVVGSLGTVLPGAKGTALPDSFELKMKGRVSELGIDTLYATVLFRRGALELRQLLLRGRAGDFDFAGRAERGAVEADVSMRGFDLGLVERFVNFGLKGSGDGALRVLREGDSWAFSGEVRFHGFRTGKVEITEGLLAVDVKVDASGAVSGRVAVGGEGVLVAGQEWNAAQVIWTGPEFDARFEKGTSRLTAQGELELKGRGLELSLNALEFVTEKETVALLSPGRFLWADSVVTLEKVKFGIAGGEVELSGRTVSGKPATINFQARHLNLRKVQELAGIKSELEGVFDIELRGRADSLLIEFCGRDFNVAALGLSLKFVRGALTAHKDRGELNALEFVYREDTSYLKGEFAYSSERGRLRLKRALVELSLADPGPWLFKVAQPYVTVKEGVVYGRMKVNWEPELLSLAGRARVTRGSIFVPAVATTVEEVDAELTLSADRLVFEKISGKSARGTVTAEGLVDLNPLVDVDSLFFRTHFTGVSAVPMSGVFAIGQGEVNITWHRGEARAFVEGNAVLDEALVASDFGQNGAGGGEAGVNYDLQVRADRGVWLRNRYADIELGVELNIRQVDEQAVFTGELVSRQGSVYYLDHILRVREGRLSFDNTSGFDPRMEITAELPITRAQATGSRPDLPDKIVLSITGRLSAPVFTLKSEPEVWDETSILSYLGLNVTMDELTALEQRELMNRLLSERLLGYFSTQVAKRVRGVVNLDYLDFETGILSGQGARVTVGKYVGRNLYVSYTQNFTGELAPVFLIEYYLSRRNELIAERSSDGRYSIRYRFKLRY